MKSTGDFPLTILQSSNQAAKPSGKPDAFGNLDTYGPAP